MFHPHLSPPQRNEWRVVIVLHTRAYGKGFQISDVVSIGILSAKSPRCETNFGYRRTFEVSADVWMQLEAYLPYRHMRHYRLHNIAFSEHFKYLECSGR